MTAASRKPWTGRTVLFVMLACFGLIVAVNAALSIFALSSHPGMVSENAYVEGVKFNRALDRAQAQDGLGWRFALDFADRGRGLILSVRGADGAPVAGLRGIARIQRPGEAPGEFTLVERAPGVLAVTADVARRGRWLVEIAATDPAGRPIELRRELWRD